jgi:hypothetical protein
MNFSVPQYNLCHITGHVVAEGVDVPDVTVSAASYDGACISSSASDINGDFDIAVIPGTYALTFNPPGSTMYLNKLFKGEDGNGYVVTGNAVLPTDITLDTLIKYLFSGYFSAHTLGGYDSALVHANNPFIADSLWTSTTDGNFVFNLCVNENYAISAVLYSDYNNQNSQTGTNAIYQVFDYLSGQGSYSMAIPLPTYSYSLLEGIVTDIKGIALSGMRIDAAGLDGICSAWSYTDSQGYYALKLIRGQYTLTVTSPPGTYPPYRINGMNITGDCQRDIRLSSDDSILEAAIGQLKSNLDIALDVFDIINQGNVNTLSYTVEVTGTRSLLEIVLDWADSQKTMQVVITAPPGSQYPIPYGTYTSSQPPLVVPDIPNPAQGTWTCTVTAIDVPHNNYLFSLVAGLTHNQAPVANAGGPYSGYANSAILFDAGNSTDNEGPIVLYEWDWDNDGIYDLGTPSSKASHTWTSAHSGTVGLRVTDSRGLTSTSTCLVSVAQITHNLNTSVSGGHGTVLPGSGTYDQGQVVPLTATPDSVYQVKAWHGTDNDSSTSTSNSVTMNTDRTVTVEFQLIPPLPVTYYTLSTSVGSGSGTIQPSSGSYSQGMVTLTATPSSGYQVKAWHGTNNDSSTSTSNTVTMNANRTVSVDFVLIPAPTTYTLSTSVAAGSGTVQPVSGTYGNGAVVPLTATPASGYQVKAWHGTDNDSSTSTTNSVTMNANRTVTVEFVLIPVPTYTLSSSVSTGSGTIQPTSGTYNKDTVVTLTATPQSGYHVKAWHGTNNDASTSTTNTVTMSSNRTVTVDFELTSGYTLNASVTNGHGAITASPPSGPYSPGAIVNLTATPESGYKIKAWTGTDDDASTSDTNTVTMNADHTVTVEFVSDSNPDSGSGGGGGGGCFITTCVSAPLSLWVTPLVILLGLVVRGLSFPRRHRRI